VEVIALRGKPSQGKSETLNTLFQFMLLFGYTQVNSTHYRVLGNPVGKDFLDIIEKKGKKVGFATMGDYGYGKQSVAILLNYLNTNGCDVAICAWSTGVSGIKSAITAYPNHQIIKKSVAAIPADQRIKNGEDAEKIYKLL